MKNTELVWMFTVILLYFIYSNSKVIGGRNTNKNDNFISAGKYLLLK